MLRQRLWIIFIVFLLPMILVACDSGNSEDVVLPTRVQSDEEPSVDTSPVPESGVTAEPIATERPSRSLPPSWTPTLAPTLTETPEPTPTREGGADAVPTIPPGCATFRPDASNSVTEFTLGESPVVSWIAADGAQNYRVRVTTEVGFELTTDAPIVSDTSIALDSELFTESGRYGWTVEPLDSNGIQMCIGLGGSFIVNE